MAANLLRDQDGITATTQSTKTTNLTRIPVTFATTSIGVSATNRFLVMTVTMTDALIQ
jgi:hypothetical protein